MSSESSEEEKEDFVRVSPFVGYVYDMTNGYIERVKAELKPFLLR